MGSNSDVTPPEDRWTLRGKIKVLRKKITRQVKEENRIRTQKKLEKLEAARRKGEIMEVLLRMLEPRDPQDFGFESSYPQDKRRKIKILTKRARKDSKQQTLIKRAKRCNRTHHTKQKKRAKHQKVGQQQPKPKKKSRFLNYGKEYPRNPRFVKSEYDDDEYILLSKVPIPSPGHARPSKLPKPKPKRPSLLSMLGPTSPILMELPPGTKDPGEENILKLNEF